MEKETTKSYYAKCMIIPSLRHIVLIRTNTLYGINPKPPQMSDIEAFAKSLYEDYVKRKDDIR